MLSPSAFPFVPIRVGQIMNAYKLQEQLIYNTNARRFQIATFSRTASQGLASGDVDRRHTILNFMDKTAGIPDVML